MFRRLSLDWLRRGETWSDEVRRFRCVGVWLGEIRMVKAVEFGCDKWRRVESCRGN